jgi:hypothetical protein
MERHDSFSYTTGNQGKKYSNMGEKSGILLWGVTKSGRHFMVRLF